jgi:hypothetical protein
MDSYGSPSSGSGLYTFQQIYDYLNSGTPATIADSFQMPSVGPVSTEKKTLTDIYDDIKAKFDECEVTDGDVRTGKIFFSTQPGNWGVQAGTR